MSENQRYAHTDGFVFYWSLEDDVHAWMDEVLRYAYHAWDENLKECYRELNAKKRTHREQGLSIKSDLYIRQAADAVPEHYRPIDRWSIGVL